MKVSFVTVSWNVCDLLERCLRSIEQTSQEIVHEIIVVDNASQDGSADMVAQMFPRVKLIRNNENRGFAAACNQGIAESSGSYLFFLNPDAELDSHALARMVAYMDTHPDVGMCAPQIRNADGSIQRSIQRFPTPLSQLGVLFKIRKVAPWFLRRYYADDFEYGRDEQDVEQPDGAALFVRRSALRKSGVFDEQFFLWFDEVDLCKRMRIAGFRIVYLNRVRVIHQAGKSFVQKRVLEKQQIFFTSCARYLKKHCGLPGFLAAFIMQSAVGVFALLDAKRYVFLAPISIPTSPAISPTSRHDTNTFLYVLFFIISIELLSLAAYFYGPIGAVTLGLISAFAFLVTLWRLEYGVAIILGELIIGSKGYLFFMSVGGFTISARMMLFIAVLAGWLLYLLKKRHGTSFFQSSLRWWWMILGGAVMLGGAIALLNGNDRGLLAADANAWLFFLLLPLIYDALKRREQIMRVLTVCVAALTAHLIKVLVVFYMMGHRGFGDDVLTVVYRWIRSTGVGELTQLDSLYRIFFQSQIYVVVAFFILLWMVASSLKNHGIFQKSVFTLLLFIGTIASLTLSFSRSFWLATGLMLAVFAFGILLYIKRDPLFVVRMCAVVFGGAVISFVLLFAISAIPFPSREGVFSVDMLSERLEDIRDEAAAASRWSLLPIMVSEIQKNPLFGYGFGKTLTYRSSDPRILLQNESGEYMTYAFEWGYFDLLLKLGLIGFVAYFLLLAALFVKGASAMRRCLEAGMLKDAVLIRGLLYGFSALLIVHFFTPYLNHPLGIGIVMLVGVLSERLGNNHSETSAHPLVSSPLVEVRQ